MVKKSVLVILSSFLLLSVTFTPKVLAQSADDDTVVLGKDEVVNQDYFAAGSSVTIHGTINGDAYIFGGTIIVDGVINGDLITAGGTVNVGGEVKNDLRVAGGNVIVEGKVGGSILGGAGTLNLTKSSSIGGSLIAGSGMMNINTQVNKNVWLGSGQVRINSNLKSDVLIGADEVVLDSEAKVDGNLTYWSENQIKLLQGASVSGIVKREEIKKIEQAKFLGLAWGFSLMMKIASTMTLIILGFLMLRFFPKKTVEVSSEVGKNPLASFGWGVGVSIVTLFAILILVIAVLGLPLAALLLVTFGMGIYLSSVFVGLWLGRTLFSNLDTTGSYHWALMVGLILLGLITMLPIVGWLLKVISVCVGLGALIRVKRSTYQELKGKL